ncbi:type I restriction-modification system subunit M N-terminal domain-containing protein [Salmonella enterica subsp. enterica serovar 4,[5],12:i:-]
MTNEEFKKTLWDAANSLRGSVSAAAYKYPVLGLVFLKFVSDMFEAQAEIIKNRLAEPQSDLYIADEDIVSALESASFFPKISSSHLKSITSSLDFYYDHSRTC